jgi:hypothetical protein
VKGRPSRLTQDRIRQLNEVNFIYEARRGGPRRPARASDIVPSEPTPAKGSERRRATLYKPIDLSEMVDAAKSEDTSHLQMISDPTLTRVGTTPGLSTFRSAGLSSNPVLQLRPNVHGDQLLAQYLSLQGRNPAVLGISPLAAQSMPLSFESQLNVRTSAELDALQQFSTLRRITNAESAHRQYAGIQRLLLDSTIPTHVRASLLQRLVPTPSIPDESSIRPAVQVPVANVRQDARLLSIIPLATPPFLEEAGYEYALVPRSLLQDLRAQQQGLLRARDDSARDDASRARGDPSYTYQGHQHPS